MTPYESIVSGLETETPALRQTASGPVTFQLAKGQRYGRVASPKSHASGLNARGMLVSYPSIFEIQVAVARRFGLTTVDLQRRGSGRARPRMLGYWLARNCTLASLPEIGRAFGGRDHSTVIHGIRRVEELLRSDPEFAWAAVSLRYELTPKEIAA